ncbi:MAG: 2,3-bisphosphoglycerate-independent phosphoglycerate mutase [Actinomycetota bacterium]|nr:2,3-bisphosphoglycerate-independent phosphoglycerate mutase [Actinomycetota bacterium]
MSTVPSVCLVILDGWGLAEDGPGNAVSLADTPVFDALWERHDHTTLTACGEAVGLPPGQMGNSEVGHLNLGAGAIVPQDLLRIDKAVEDGSLAENEVIRAALREAPRVHLIGLVSDGGVHSSDRHLKALIEQAAKEGVEDLVIHAFTDGRDTSPHGGADMLAKVQEWLEEAGVGRIGSVVGRYFAMDRDTRWDRTEKAVELLMEGEAEHEAESGEAAARAAYDRDETDEFIITTKVGDEDATIRPGDSVLAFNFRPDRMRQITEALTKAGVDRYATLTEYEEGWPYPVAFPPERPGMTLARLIADRGEKQLHVSETEKYPHVTYFFNGGEEEPYDGEVRELVDSPRDVATYDEKPEMSAREAADAFVQHWESDAPVFGIINFANADMVGHTGVIPAAVKGVETVDECLGRIVEAVHGSGGACIIVADHGNADEMLEEDGSPDTAHSLNPVPFIVTLEGARLDGEGILADVAPTALALLGIEQPEEMTGRSLLAAD